MIIEDGEERTEEDEALYLVETIEDNGVSIDRVGADNIHIFEDGLVEHVVQDEEEEIEGDVKVEVESDQMFFCGVVEKEEVVVKVDQEQIRYHSYPRIKSPPTRKRRRGVEKMIQADMDGDEEEEQIWQKETNVVHLVDVGTQVCQTDLMLHQHEDAISDGLLS